jgi:hypothetical protein
MTSMSVPAHGRKIIAQAQETEAVPIRLARIHSHHNISNYLNLKHLYLGANLPFQRMKLIAMMHIYLPQQHLLKHLSCRYNISINVHGSNNQR